MDPKMNRYNNEVIGKDVNLEENYSYTFYER
jgi:hypothetical protein